MKTKYLLFSMVTVAMFSVATLITIVFNTAPTTIATIVIFYSSLFFSSSSVLFLGAYSYSHTRSKVILPWQTTMSMIRYSAIISLIIGVAVAMSAYNLLNVTSGVIVVVAGLVVELLWRRQAQKIT